MSKFVKSHQIITTTKEGVIQYRGGLPNGVAIRWANLTPPQVAHSLGVLYAGWLAAEVKELFKADLPPQRFIELKNTLLTAFNSGFEKTLKAFDRGHGLAELQKYQLPPDACPKCHSLATKQIDNYNFLCLSCGNYFDIRPGAPL